ncbi:MAG: formylglycine-generating enzyme family protein [bacterium]|nr:formylglycine-generating enzyme family protein [bacterium]
MPQPEPDAWGARLAGQALVESADLSQVSERNRDKVERVRTHLVRVLEAGQMAAVERVAAGCILAKLGDPRPGVGVGEDGLPDIAWCEVPAGLFAMGSPDDSLAFFGEETPQRQVDLAAFRVSRYPVTNAQFTAFVRAGGYRERQYWTDAGWERKEREKWTRPDNYGDPLNLPNHPVVGVSWYEAVAFCAWLTGQLRQLGALGNDEEISLPSESQWEKVARGVDGRIYPWGDDADPERANYADTGIGATSAVGCFPSGASSHGAEDLSSNVWEWCRTKFQDSYDDYWDDNDLEGSDRRVLRGGAFLDDARLVRCAVRLWDPPDFRLTSSGFRLVLASPSAL